MLIVFKVFEILSRQVTDKQDDVARFKDGLNQTASRLYGLENLQANFEGFEEGVKEVMMWQRAKGELHVDGSVTPGALTMRPVAEVVEVPERFEMAMEAALGSRLQLLVSDSSETALSALDYLKANTKGRSSFVASDWMANVSDAQAAEIKAQPGVESILSDVVNISDEKRRLLAPFFDSVVVVDSIRTALGLRARYSDRTFVTLDGDCLSADGVLTGGTAGSAAGSGLLLEMPS